MTSPRILGVVVLLLVTTWGGNAYSSDYDKLTLQEKADLARFLGWVWGDGRPGDDGTGIIYQGSNRNYGATVARLAEIRFDGRTNPFGFPTGSNRRLTQAWNYWDDSLPGGNPGDPEVLRDAIRHPNFLAGLLEGEGQIFHNNPDAPFYVADQSYSPSHPDRSYDIANFGPERMVQLFELLAETYGFSNPSMTIGNRRYHYDSERCQAIEDLQELHDQRRAQNESGDLQSGFTVRVFINPINFPEVRNYGYFEKFDGRYRTPAPDSQLQIIRSTRSNQNTEASGSMTFFDNEVREGTRLQNLSGDFLTDDLIGAPSGGGGLWQLVNLGNGYQRIVSRNSATVGRFLRAEPSGGVTLAPSTNTWHQTQWEVIPVSGEPSQVFLRNRFSGDYLRIAPSDLRLEHGVRGSAARWSLEGIAGCQ